MEPKVIFQRLVLNDSVERAVAMRDRQLGLFIQVAEAGGMTR